ncbi:Sas10 domain-containing protein [Aphelenchoides fujianensis]|nr:Sas10 domain-containing protein [Aphelenchoides fujianensis]
MGRGKKRRSAGRGGGERPEEDTDDVFDEVDRLHNALDAELDVEASRRRRSGRQLELMPIQQPLDDAEVYDEQEDEADGPPEKRLPNVNEWGRKRRAFYVDAESRVREDGQLNDEEQEALELEEEDAVRRQRRSDSAHALVDFGRLSALVEPADGEEAPPPPRTIEFVDDEPPATLGALRRQRDAPVPVERKAERPRLPPKRPTLAAAADALAGWSSTDEEAAGEDEEHREINREMEKNAGIRLKKRKKGTEHSRVKRRLQYQKALVKRRSQVPDVKRELAKYSGEARGIRASTVRSIPLK